MKRLLIAIFAFVLAAPLARPTQAQANNTFTVVTESAPSDLDPASSYDENSNVPLRGIYEGLVTLKGESLTEIEPVLAESVDNQADTVYTFKLRKGVKFHDGTDFNADAAKFGLARTVTAKLGTEGILGTFLSDPDKQIRAADPYTLVITFTRPQPQFLVALAASYGTGLVSPTAVQRNKGSDNGHTWLQTHEAGTGPYTLAGELDGSKPTTLKRFDAYWRGWSGTHFDQVVVQTIAQSGQRRRALEQGKADAATFLLPDDLTTLELAGGYLLNKNPTLRIDFLIMATSYGPLQDVSARQALSYAFDYAAYNRAELGGRGRQPNGPFPNTLLGANPNTFTYKTDLKQAKTLLDSIRAKVPPGTTFTLAAPEGRGDLAGAILRQNLEQLGYFLTVKKYPNDEYQALLTAGPSADRPDLFLQSWWPDYNSPLNFALPIFASESAEGGQNAGYLRDAKVDQIIKAGQNARSNDELVRLFVDLQTEVTQLNPAGIYMAQSPDRTAVSGKIKNHSFNVLYLGTFDFYAISR